MAAPSACSSWPLASRGDENCDSLMVMSVVAQRAPSSWLPKRAKLCDFQSLKHMWGYQPQAVPSLIIGICGRV